jgi:DNA repair photolyase
LDDSVNKIFEPGATPPSQRLEALKSSKENGFLTGVSLMPLLPSITDTTQALDHFFSVFSLVPIDYIFPATLTLFGSGRADSKTLMLNAIDKHYPELTEKYQKLFGNSDQLPFHYRNAFNKKMNQLCESYQIKNRLI